MDKLNPEKGTGRRMLLLGGLSALALNEGARRKLAEGTRDLLGQAQEAVGDTVDSVKPTLAQAAAEAGHAAHQATRKTARTVDTLRDKAPAHAESVLDRAGDAVEAAAGTVTAVAGAGAAKAAAVAHDVHRGVKRGVEALGETVEDLAEDAGRALQGTGRQVRREVRAKQAQGARAAGKAARVAAARRRQGEHLLKGAAAQVRQEAHAHNVQGARDAGAAVVSAETALRHAEQALRAARVDAGKELRAMQRAWNTDEIEREVRRQVGSLSGGTRKELARLSKQKGRVAKSEARGGGSGGLVGLLLLGTGAVVLARVPAARQAILGAVGRVSPEAAENLHRASRRAREIVGTMWIEHIEEPAPAPAAAGGTQAGTTGATWGGSPAAGSAAAGGPSTPAQNSGNKTN
ncbi:hypothetical protein [Deinococcus aestuarii]|uniref:hypothetical protein n=1 Tax=Deinococcus aestuarii TaxID=2774531 RepID=UPI001C0AC773|nr:hypothetical protein [Deinococcus aestuarii]